MNKFCMIGCLLVLCVVSSGTVCAEKTLLDELRDLDVFQIRSGKSACPLPLVGESCPPSNAFYHFRCCGQLNESCCFRLQDWLIASVALVSTLIALCCVVNLLIRCLSCNFC